MNLDAIRGMLAHFDNEPPVFDSDNFARIHASRYWLLVGHAKDLFAALEFRLRDADLLRDRIRELCKREELLEHQRDALITEAKQLRFNADITAMMAVKMAEKMAIKPKESDDRS